MSYQQHRSAEENQAKAQEDCIALAISAEERHSCDKEAQDRKNYSPWGYILMTWPEGITTWAIIGTGFVIAWQSNETRKSTKAAQRTVVFIKKQLAMQEAQLTQWLELETNGLFTHAEDGQPAPLRLSLFTRDGTS